MCDNAKETRKDRCPRCGSVETRRAVRADSPPRIPALLRRYRKCTSCECVFEPPAGRVASTLFLLFGLLILSTRVASALAMSGDPYSATDWLLTTIECYGGLYLSIVGARSLFFVRR